MREKTFNKTEYEVRWHKENTKQYPLKFRNGEDDQIIKKLKEVGSKSAYIKTLILKDIEESKYI